MPSKSGQDAFRLTRMPKSRFYLLFCKISTKNYFIYGRNQTYLDAFTRDRMLESVPRCSNLKIGHPGCPSGNPEKVRTESKMLHCGSSVTKRFTNRPTSVFSFGGCTLACVAVPGCASVRI